MHLNTEFLSRIQFGFTIAFHILFPAFSIGMATFIAMMEATWLITRKHIYLTICKFWTKIFALTFGMGIVSGIVMEFQLGTNWSGYTFAAGPVLGSLFTYEVMTAFFIEAGFLGVMIFGWDKVGKALHFLATLLVLSGVTLSAFWIMSANSWMQTPAGVVFINGRFDVMNWMQVIFNPSVIPRFIHMLLATWIATALVVAGVGAHYLLQKKHTLVAKKIIKFALISLIILMPLQIFMGDRVGLEVHKYQPIKTAAIESLWQTTRGAPLVLFAIPDQTQQKNLYSIEIPKLASLINTHTWNGELQGLNSVSPQDQPFVALVFFSFRIMVGIGVIILIIAFLGIFLLVSGRLYQANNYLKIVKYSAPLGFPAIIAGWITAEVGRQPWVIYDYLRTSAAVSNVSLYHLIVSLALIIIVYGIIFGIFYFRYFARIVATGPAKIEEPKMPFAYLHGSEGETKNVHS